MHSQHDNSSTSSFNNESVTGNSEKTMPLGIGEFSDDAGIDPLAGVSERKKFNAGSLVLVAVVVMACGGLWFMRSLSHVSGASNSQSDVEANIDKFLKSIDSAPSSAPAKNVSQLTQEDTGVLAVLGGSYVERQVPLSSVARNPFIIYGDSLATPGAETNIGGSLAKRQQARQAQFQKVAEQLELKSVIMGSQPLANISGKIVRKGDEIVMQPDNVAFRVVEIGKESAMLIAEDVELQLSVPVTVVLKRDK